MMTFEIFMEIFGYIGTAVVITSMLMTSVTKLRIVNICGAIISLIYAAYCGALPVVLLNGALAAINIVQLICARKNIGNRDSVKADTNE